VKLAKHFLVPPTAIVDPVRRTFTIRLPIHTVSEANRADHEHWRVRQKRAKAQRSAVALWAPRTANVPRDGSALPCTVELVRIAPRKLDSEDNDRMSLKHVRDGIADWLGVNDRDPRVTWRYNFRREQPRTYGVEIIITMADRP